MENQEQRIRTFRDDPQYFGAFLNMARLNIFNISNHLSSEFYLKPLDEEGQIKNSFLANKDNKKVKWNHVYSILKRFVPVVKVFDFEFLPKTEQEAEIIKGNKNYGRKFSEMSDSLKIIFKELNEFRNDYSHFFSTEKGNDRKQIISNELANFLDANFKRAIAYTKARFKDIYNDEDFELAEKITLFTSDKIITQDGIVFLTSMFLEREHAFQFIGKIKGLKGTQYNSFLATREVMMAYCVNLPHDKFVSDDPKQALSLDIINELNRCPNTLFNVISEKEKKQFKPKLNEDKTRNIIENSVTDGVFDYDEYIQNITKKIRHSNRFSFFALKLIDETKVFKKIRFQIDLGKIVLAEYTKPLAGEDEPRQVVENAKAFGRLSDLNDESIVIQKINKQNTDAYFEQFAPHYNTDNNKIGIRLKEDTAIIIKKDIDKEVKSNLKQPLPDAFLSLHELPKIILLEYLNKGTSENIINDFISLNNSKLFNRNFIEDIKTNLSGLEIFYKRSRGRKQTSAYSDEWEKELRNRKNKLNEILKSHNLNDKQIPERILNYWLNIKDVDERHAISDRIKLMKRDCMDRLKAIRKGKSPKVGEMATFLAKDIVDMIIDKDKKKRITSFYYDKMQECLALYNMIEKRQLFIDICSTKELDLFNTEQGHPFLKNINPAQIKYPSDFYEKYLQEKGHKMIPKKNNKTGKLSMIDESWLANFYKLEWSEKNKKNMTVVKLPDDKSKIPFTIRQLEKKQPSFDEWFNNVTKGKETTDHKKPVDLPTDIFDIKIKNILQEKLTKAQVIFDEDSYYNKLFKLWWTHCREDSVQNFYDAEREYVIYEEPVRFKINTKSKFSDYYQTALINSFSELSKKRNEERKEDRRLPEIDKKQVEKVFRNIIGTTEKEIRILQEEDRLMVLMLESLLGNEGDLQLKLNKIKVLLNETITIKQNVSGKLSFDQAGEIVKDKNQKQEIIRTLTDTRKRKDFSVLRKFIFDRRLPELFEYFNDNEIPIEKLKIELEAYNKSKEQVFDSVFRLEEAIIGKDKVGINALFKDEIGNIQTGNIQHKPYLDWLLSKKFIGEGEFKFLNMVRNTFSHNQFPQKKTMELFIKNWNEAKIAEQIIEVYNQKIEKLIERIKKL